MSLVGCGGPSCHRQSRARFHLSHVRHLPAATHCSKYPHVRSRPKFISIQCRPQAVLSFCKQQPVSAPAGHSLTHAHRQHTLTQQQSDRYEGGTTRGNEQFQQLLCRCSSPLVFQYPP